MVRRARFRAQLHALLLQGIAFGGFNVVDIHAVHAALRLPVIIVARRAPDLAAIERALRTRVRGGARKWRLIERAGPMQALAGVYVQCAGISLTQAGQLIRKLTIHSRLPEPLRTAHLIAGGVTTGESRHRA
jgi:hypothetical protein